MNISGAQLLSNTEFEKSTHYNEMPKTVGKENNTDFAEKETLSSKS